ncbi:MAG: hypothetical protein ACRELV_12420 [Longimicrobiales bacterium]
MAATGQRIRVYLHWFQILDTLDPSYQEKGEFRFTAKVTVDGQVHEHHFPKEGHYSISDHPAWNKMPMQSVLFEGVATGELAVELNGEEFDFLSDSDHLEPYRRSFTGDPVTWIGRYCPGDEAPQDPENMGNWRVCYEIQKG